MTTDINGNSIASHSSFDEFIVQFSPADVNEQNRFGQTALQGALRNQDPEARYRITSWLLDHGAEPHASRDDNGTVLHCLFSQQDLDPVRDAELLQRLLDAGADINKASGKFGRPLQYLVQTHGAFAVKKHPNPEIAKRLDDGKVFLDIMFSRPDLNLTGRSKKTGESFGAYLIYLSAGGYPTDIEDRVRAYLTAQGKDADEVLTPMRGRDMPVSGPESKPERVHTPGEPITVTATDPTGQYRELWRLLVPGSGHAESVQGEMIRIAGRVGYEILNNGGINWDDDFEAMLDFFVQTMASLHPLNAAGLARVANARRALHGGSFSEEAVDDITNASVAWVLQNPDRVPLPDTGYQR